IGAGLLAREHLGFHHARQEGEVPELERAGLLEVLVDVVGRVGSPRRLRCWSSRSLSLLAIALVLLPVLVVVGGLGRGRALLAEEPLVAVRRALVHARPLEVLIELRRGAGPALGRAGLGLRGLARDDARDRVVVEGAVPSGAAQGLGNAHDA